MAVRGQAAAPVLQGRRRVGPSVLSASNYPIAERAGFGRFIDTAQGLVQVLASAAEHETGLAREVPGPGAGGEQLIAASDEPLSNHRHLGVLVRRRGLLAARDEKVFVLV